jgi:hypothetical protein
MKKRIFPRIVWFLLLNCVAFVILVSIQFTHRGTFSQKIGDMLIKGYYTPEADGISIRQPLYGGATVFFGGLEFRLAFTSGTDEGFSLVDPSGEKRQVFPEYVTFAGKEAVFTLPGGTELSFVSQNPDGQPDKEGAQGSAPELRISGKFPNGIAAINIPFRTQRSSMIRGSGSEMLSIVYNGSRYQFSRPLHGLEEGGLVLLASTPTISYRVVTDTKEINPADFIVPQAQNAQAFEGELSRWIARSSELWAHMGTQIDEDTVIAWCGEAIRQGNYSSAALSVVPASFSSSPQRSWESGVYQFDRRIGVWERAARSLVTDEREKINRIGRLLAEKDFNLFAENHLIEFLAIRGDDNLIDRVLSFAQEIDPSVITPDISPGILEGFLDMGKWRPQMANPFEPVAEQACRISANGLYRTGNQSFVFYDSRADTEFNLRLGKAILGWGEKSGETIWTELGRSLVLSVISLSGNNGSVPALLTVSRSGDFSASVGRINTSRLYRLWSNNEYLPHATATGVNGIWAWTAASSVNITRNDQQMNIAIRFPVGGTHYIMLRNVRPFPLLQIYDQNWRRAADFESYYNSSGWYYFEEEQILVLKISHRSNIENVRIFYTVPRVEPPPPPAPREDREEWE